MTKKPITNIIFTCAVVLFAVLYLATDSLLSKAAASICFMVMGLINYIRTKSSLQEYRKFSILLLIGLFMAMLGDIILNNIFIAGAAIFALGHIFFYAALCQLCPPDGKNRQRDLICMICLFLINMSILIFAPLQYSNNLMFVVCILYAAIISVMTGKAISNYIGKRTSFFRYMVSGTVLFLLSDIMLVLFVFMGNSTIIHCIAIALYYIAEILLADSYLVLEKNIDQGSN